MGTAVTTHLGLEAEVAVIPDLLTHVGDFKAALLSGHVLYSPLGNAPVLPYGVVGGAFVRLADQTAQVGTATEIAITLGGGVWVPVSDWISLRIDLHDGHAVPLERTLGGIALGNSKREHMSQTSQQPVDADLPTLAAGTHAFSGPCVDWLYRRRRDLERTNDVLLSEVRGA